MIGGDEMEKAVQVQDLRKVFITRKKKFLRTIEKKEFVAVDGVSFDIEQGEIFGLLGPNGAGKTTTIKMITGLLRPTAGTVKVKGTDVDKRPLEALKKLGTVLAGDRSVYWKLTARENLEYFASLYGCSRSEAAKRAEKVLQKLQLAEKADVLVEKYSTGMKQKVALGKALIPEAPVLLLDEPTLGLDPQSALNLREIIMELKKEGHAILLTTHYMEEADFLCDRIAIVDSGKIIALDTPENLKNGLNELKTIRVEVKRTSPEVIGMIKAIEGIDRVSEEFKEDSATHVMTIHHSDGEEVVQKMLDCLYKNNIDILNINVVRPSLEDVFIHLTGKKLREQVGA